MLTKLDKCIRRILIESTDDSSRQILDCNEFYFRYIEPAAEGLEVSATKQRENTFLVYGSIKNIKAFFLKLKVDKEFMENPSDFVIYDPIFTYGEIEHNMHYDEFYPIFHDVTYPKQTHEVDNEVRYVAEGRWYPIIDENGNDAKQLKPSEISKYFKSFFPKINKDMNESLTIYVEFQVDCDGFANQIWGKMSEYAKTPDEFNKQNEKQQDADFNYTSLNEKNVNDEADVKAALKNVKRTKKEYTTK